jgi:hypothetical protein
MPNPTTVSGEVERVARTMQNAELSDGEGNTYRLFDLLDFSGENKAVTITRQLAEAALSALRVEPPYEPDGSDAPIRDSVEPPSDVAELPEAAVRTWALRLCETVQIEAGQITLFWAEGFVRQLHRAFSRDEADTILSLQRQIAERDEVLREARDCIAVSFHEAMVYADYKTNHEVIAKLSALIGNGEVSDDRP